jgi:hypothetical protein
MSETRVDPHPSVRARVSGHAFTLRQRDVWRAVSRTEPGEIRDHFVEIDGRRYPVKQALAVATGLDPSDFTSQHARSVLRRLGLKLGRLSTLSTTRVTGHPSARPLSDYEAQAAAHKGRPSDRAETLRPYQNRWVALQRDHVLTDGDSFSEVLAWLRHHDVKADAVFLVPNDPAGLLTGLTN